jgi:tetratricopeptide (TPR) repeat protein
MSAAQRNPPVPSLNQNLIGAIADLVNQGRWSEVEHQARALLNTHPNVGMIWKIMSVALVRQGKEALPALRRTTELLPDDAEAHSNLGAALRDQGQWVDAVSSLRRALSIDSNVAATHDTLGTALRGLGQWQDALASFRRALKIRPDYTIALIHAGDTLSSIGRAREAVALYQGALQLNPRLLEAQNNLGNALFELGQYEDAAGCYRGALQIKSDDPKIHGNLGNALRQLGRLHEAIASCRQAIVLDPTLSEAHNNLGLALAALGRFEEALASYRRALALDANYVDALNNLGNVLRDLGERRESVSLYARAIELDPGRPESHCNLGNVLFEFRRIEEAAASYAQALALKPDYAAAHLSLGMTLRMQGRATDAEASCRAALAIDPNCVEALSLLGELLADRGQFSEAQELFRRVIAIDPNFPFVFLSIAMHRKMTSVDSEWLQGTQALVAKRLPLRHEISLRYALGKYFDDVKQYDQAFDNYRQANELTKRSGLVYDATALTRRVDRIMSSFDATSMRQLQAQAHPSERPVFIVGMPRSGTSLTEQILASHSAVFGAGELTFWDTAFAAHETAALKGHVGANLMPGMAAGYLEQLARISSDALRVVDKMPPNFMNLGLIHAAFPRARIIHMRRNPIDTCLSIYFQYFLNTHPYANDLGSLAHYYGEYVRIMNHWRRALPATTLLEIPYESLVEDQEGWIRRMVEFLGLEWDPKCLDFHRTNRVVITASKWQVRQKIHTASAGRWRNYEKFVGPLLPLIEMAGWN